jgi:putative addiction module component (TIGR02574 family)
MIDNALLEKIRNLEPADRLELIGVVWDSLVPADLPLTDGERDLLDARLADLEHFKLIANLQKERTVPSNKLQENRFAPLSSQQRGHHTYMISFCL